MSSFNCVTKRYDLNTDWEQRKLGEVTERITRKNKNLESTLPLTISARDGLVDQNAFFNKQVASKDISNYYLLRNGEFAYNKSYSKDYPWGAIKRLENYEMGVLSTLYIVFQTQNINSDFLVTYYDTNKWHKEISVRAAEGARNHGLLNIAPVDFFETVLKIPNDFEEQNLIGLFLKKLDNTIALHQQKLDQLSKMKISLLQDIFPTDGQNRPKIRFTYFYDIWEKRKLSSKIISELKGKARREMVGNGSEYLDTIHLNGGESQKVNSPSNVTKEDIIILWDGSKAGTIYHGFSGALGSTLKSYKIKGSSSFLYQYLKKYQHLIYENYRTPNIPHVNKNFTNEFYIYETKNEEENKIGKLLNNIDAIVDLHQQKIDKLQQIKKAYLQKMFI
ncbi:restriction endonuclease subunit S [Dellaglioa algida]|uniref:Restriction endonuclease subunit S n=1 Tax=Dellaglioa algida TaxID=105612 RepID=A0A5C6M905_9LACO|nr:restriction endonuclease subunit S [Dellaglioa algida]MDK1719856.1 restriction endonuclease subunit S [Dellaglioa algida]TWW11238.1 restriction endonuclease subunit S [Dellaglioa algida]